MVRVSGAIRAYYSPRKIDRIPHRPLAKMLHSISPMLCVTTHNTTIVVANELMDACQ